MVYKFFDRMTYGSSIKNKNILKKGLTEELYKPIIRKFKKKSTFAFYRQNLSFGSCWYTINK